MSAGHGQPYESELDPVSRDAEGRGRAIDHQSIRSHVGILGEAGQHHVEPAIARRCHQRPGTGIVGVEDHERSHRVHEGAERCGVCLDGAVVVEVISINVGDDRTVRVVDEKGTVALVGLDNQ